MNWFLRPHLFYRSYRFFFLSFQEKKFFWQAFFWLIFAKIAIPIFPFKKLQKYLGEVSQDSSAEIDGTKIDPAEIDFMALRLKIKLVKASIARARKVLPFHCQCLVTAICARKLLKDLGCSPRLYLGLAKEKQPKKNGHGLMAHAWVKLGDEWIVGQSATDFTVVKIFA